MFLKSEVELIVEETHPNKQVQAFYYEHIQSISTSHENIIYHFDSFNDLLNTCIILSVHIENTLKNIVEKKSEDKKWQAREIIQSLTFYSIIGKMIFKYVDDECLANKLFMFFNDVHYKCGSEDGYTKDAMFEELAMIIKN